jgi:hypothetical protein
MLEFGVYSRAAYPSGLILVYKLRNKRAQSYILGVQFEILWQILHEFQVFGAQFLKLGVQWSNKEYKYM